MFLRPKGTKLLSKRYIYTIAHNQVTLLGSCIDDRIYCKNKRRALRKLIAAVNRNSE